MTSTTASKENEVVVLLEKFLDNGLYVNRSKYQQITKSSYERGAIVSIFDDVGSLRHPQGAKSIFLKQSEFDQIEYTEGSKMVREYDPAKEVVLVAGVILNPESEVDSLYLCRRFTPREWVSGGKGEVRNGFPNGYEDFLTKEGCVICGTPSKKKCSKCGTKYCCREHQMADWPKHKLVCKQRQEENKKYARVVQDKLN